MKFKFALVVLVALVVVLLAGCASKAPTGGAVVCNKPYILVGNSCCLDSNVNGICDADEQKPAAPVEEPKPEPVLSDEFKLVKGDSVKVAGKIFTLVDYSIFQGKLETVVDVDGMEKIIYGTKEPEVVNGLRITPLSVDRLQTYILVNVEPLKLQADEYLLEVDKDTVVLGERLRLRDVQDDNGVLVENADSDIRVFVMPGITKTLDGLRITNVESFFRTVKSERYAILKIVGY